MPTETIEVDTDDRVAVVDVTDAVADTVPAGLESGVCHVIVAHTTAGVVVNESEPRLLDDLEGLLEAVVPPGDGYAHDAIDDNAAAHLRAMLLGGSVSIPVRDGELALGTWQSVLFVEGDGPRRRQLVVTCVPATAGAD